jgi:hypothetical protein
MPKVGQWLGLAIAYDFVWSPPLQLLLAMVGYTGGVVRPQWGIPPEVLSGNQRSPCRIKIAENASSTR